MKIHHFGLLFLAILIVIIVTVDMRVSQKTYIMTDNAINETAFDKAVDAATERLVSAGSGGISVDRDGAVDAFYSSLAVSFGIADEPVARDNLYLYVPVICVTEADGFRLYYDDIIIDESGHHARTRIWTDRIPYSYDDGYFIYNFTNSSETKIYDYRKLLGASEAFYSVDVSKIMEFERFDELINNIPSAEWTNCLLTNEAAFNEVKDLVIAETIEKYLNYYCNKHNTVASQYDINYNFVLPSIDGSMYLRAAKNVSFLAFFQGYPVPGTSEVYNRFCVSNAQAVQNEILTIDDEHLYHRNGCGHIGTVVASGFDEKDCARQGAYACPFCFPNTGARKTW